MKYRLRTWLVGALPALLSTPKAALTQEQYRFGVEVKSVYVDVFVTRGDEAVSGLTRENFDVRDNGVRQEIELVDVETVPLSALLVLDVSDSVQGVKMTHLRAAAHAFVDGLEQQDEAGLMTFSHRMRLWKNLDSDFEELHEALDRPRTGGTTALYDALFAGLKLLEAAKGRPLLLLFTDGIDMASWLNASDVLEVAKASDTIVYAVGLRSKEGVYLDQRLLSSPTREADRLLKKLTESTGGDFWYANATENLKAVYLSILAEMETRYLLSYQPQGVPEPGWHKLEVKLKGSKADRVRSRSGYFVSGGANP